MKPDIYLIRLTKLLFFARSLQLTQYFIVATYYFHDKAILHNKYFSAKTLSVLCSNNGKSWFFWNKLNNFHKNWFNDIQNLRDPDYKRLLFYWNLLEPTSYITLLYWAISGFLTGFNSLERTQFRGKCEIVWDLSKCEMKKKPVLSGWNLLSQTDAFLGENFLARFTGLKIWPQLPRHDVVSSKISLQRS